jgi:methionyl-tRNA formyltransferase
MKLKIEILCTSASHPVVPKLKTWILNQEKSVSATLLHNTQHLSSGDILFLISCNEIIGCEIRDRYKHVIVIHGSDLPKGRGWSPHIWAIIHGQDQIIVSALSAVAGVDTGPIWAKKKYNVAKYALFDELDAAFFSTEMELMDLVKRMVREGEEPTPQSEETASYYPRRTPADSEINPEKSISEQFDLIRVCNPDRYPAFFQLHGKRFNIKLERVDDEE